MECLNKQENYSSTTLSVHSCDKIHLTIKIVVSIIRNWELNRDSSEEKDTLSSSFFSFNEDENTSDQTKINVV